KLKNQILKVLIDEHLKIQEAQRYGILITSNEVNNEINRLERSLKLKTNSLIQSFKEKNIPEVVIYNQIRSQLLWNKLINITIANNIKISDKQKDEAFKNFIKNSGETEFNLSEIFISYAEAKNQDTALEKINSIYSNLTTSNFITIAEQFSDGAVISKGWIRESVLNKNANEEIKNMLPNSISKPIKSSIGYHVYLLSNKRKTKKINDNESLYNLSQIFFKFQDKNKQDITKYSNAINDLRRKVKGCNMLEETIEKIEIISGGNLGILSENALDKKFSNVIKNNLPVGILSEEIITEDGVHAIMLCEPIIKVSFDKIKQNILNKLTVNKINNASTLLLNRIRQRALIEINPI
ncbi:MAG: hypothetical protein CBE14_001530, partial [Rickettsiales bacterium TMED254]